MKDAEVDSDDQAGEFMPFSAHMSPNDPQETDAPFAGRLTCSVAEACKASGLGRTKIYTLIAEGCLESTTVGRRRLILVASLQRLLMPCKERRPATPRTGI